MFEIYKKLLDYFGRQNWWPTISKNKEDEISIGAILTQQTSWRNVEKCIENLMRENALSLKKIAEMDLEKLETLVKPSGFYKIKVERLKRFASYITKNYKTLKNFFRQDLEKCREELLSIKGIGKETADSILLYAGKKLIFVIDAYTYRILKRLGKWEDKFDYEKLRRFVESNLPKDLEVYREFHALLVELGKNFCKKKAKCEGCPLKEKCKNREVIF